MKKTVYILTFAFLLLFSACKTAQGKVDTVSPNGTKATSTTTTAQTEKADQSDANTIVAQFDTVTITKQTFKITKSEIQLVVEDLNRITYARDYNRWLTYLSDEYRSTLSDPAILEKVSASLPTKGIKLKNLKDYFEYVFVPSRQNMRVDDITFVSPVRVYVIMEITPASSAAIYILEKMNGAWKLVPKN